MKNVMMLLALCASLNSFAVTIKEYDQAAEVNCHAEIKAQGCVNKDGNEDVSCVDKKLENLSNTCKAIHTEKKK